MSSHWLWKNQTGKKNAAFLLLFFLSSSGCNQGPVLHQKSTYSPNAINGGNSRDIRKLGWVKCCHWNQNRKTERANKMACSKYKARSECVVKLNKYNMWCNYKLHPYERIQPTPLSARASPQQHVRNWSHWGSYSEKSMWCKLLIVMSSLNLLLFLYARSWPHEFPLGDNKVYLELTKVTQYFL